MDGPLEGYRIVDLTAMVSGPIATMMLAEQGTRDPESRRCLQRAIGASVRSRSISSSRKAWRC